MRLALPIPPNRGDPMLIRCPTCASGYDLPPHLLSDGRILRCAHCRDAWAYRGAASAPSIGLAIAAEARSARRILPETVASRPRSTRRRGAKRIGDTAAAAALALCVIGSGMAAIGQRERIVAALPPTAAVFATLGLPVNLRGLALAGIRSTLGAADGATTLTLDGTITNLRRQSTTVPTIRIAVRDATDRELYYWTAPAPKPRLAVGETVPFHSRLSAPPRDGETLSVSFVDLPPAAPRHFADATPTIR